MSVKICQNCKTTNASGNTGCVKCGAPLSTAMVQNADKNKNLYAALVKKAFSAFLTYGAIISVILALIAFMQHSGVNIFQIFGT